MSRFARSTRRSSADPVGFSTVELLVALALTSLVLAATAGIISSNRKLITNQALEIETNITARLVADVLARDLRLGGACLPVTGTFVAMSGDDTGERDEVTIRTGLTDDNLTCLRTATRRNLPQGERSIKVDDVTGFEPEMRIYLRGTTGEGEFLTIASVNQQRRRVIAKTSVTRDYLATSGLYAVNERSYFIDESGNEAPKLMLQLNDENPVPFATGIEKLNLRYELMRNCPACDVVDLPAPTEWPLVEQVYVKVTARSDAPKRDGKYYRRTIELAIKPRNLLPK